ncbi:hypothetical protein PYCC9005_000928 [Savitreella phatthalungensis]
MAGVSTQPSEAAETPASQVAVNDMPAEGNEQAPAQSMNSQQAPQEPEVAAEVPAQEAAQDVASAHINQDGTVVPAQEAAENNPVLAEPAPDAEQEQPSPIFITPSGEQLRIFVANTIDHRKDLLAKIRQYGGRPCSSEIVAGCIKIGNPNAPRLYVGDFVSPAWVDACISEGKVVDKRAFWINNRLGDTAEDDDDETEDAATEQESRPEPQQPRFLSPYTAASPSANRRAALFVDRTAISGKGSRNVFTHEDDKLLRRVVHRTDVATSGNKIYKLIAQEYPSHTFHSWRDRYLRYLKPLWGEPTLETDLALEEDEKNLTNRSSLRDTRAQRSIASLAARPRQQTLQQQRLGSPSVARGSSAATAEEDDHVGAARLSKDEDSISRLSNRPSASAESLFTAQEDALILSAIGMSGENDLTFKGIAFDHTQHSWQAWRDRAQDIKRANGGRYPQAVGTRAVSVDGQADMSMEDAEDDAAMSTQLLGIESSEILSSPPKRKRGRPPKKTHSRRPTTANAQVVINTSRPSYGESGKRKINVHDRGADEVVAPVSDIEDSDDGEEEEEEEEAEEERPAKRPKRSARRVNVPVSPKRTISKATAARRRTNEAPTATPAKAKGKGRAADLVETETVPQTPASHTVAQAKSAKQQHHEKTLSHHKKLRSSVDKAAELSAIQVSPPSSPSIALRRSARRAASVEPTSTADSSNENFPSNQEAQAHHRQTRQQAASTQNTPIQTRRTRRGGRDHEEPQSVERAKELLTGSLKRNPLQELTDVAEADAEAEADVDTIVAASIVLEAAPLLIAETTTQQRPLSERLRSVSPRRKQAPAFSQQSSSSSPPRRSTMPPKRAPTPDASQRAPPAISHENVPPQSTDGAVAPSSTTTPPPTAQPSLRPDPPTPSPASPAKQRSSPRKQSVSPTKRRPAQPEVSATQQTVPLAAVIETSEEVVIPAAAPQAEAAIENEARAQLQEDLEVATVVEGANIKAAVEVAMEVAGAAVAQLVEESTSSALTEAVFGGEEDEEVGVRSRGRTERRNAWLDREADRLKIGKSLLREAWHMTSGDASLATQIAEEYAATGQIQARPGFWIENDDQDLLSNDPERIAAVDRKHNGTADQRTQFLMDETDVEDVDEEEEEGEEGGYGSDEQWQQAV